LSSPAFSGGVPAALSLATSMLLISASIRLWAPQHGAAFSPTQAAQHGDDAKVDAGRSAQRNRSARAPFY
jgi:hypothetical protein